MVHIDVLIIGAGPIGLTCGIEAGKAGLSYVIIEKGCLVNSLYNYPANMTFFSTSEKLEIGDIPFVSISLKPTRAEALEYYRRAAIHYNLNIRLFELVSKVSETDGAFLIETSKASYFAKNIIVATGFYDVPVKLDIPGEDLPKVSHYYKDPHYYAMQRVAVIGAGNSAVDAALETYRKSAEVTMIVKGDEIDSRVKYWVRPDIVNRIKEGSIKAYFNSRVTAIRESEIDIESTEGKITIANDFVLAMTGYRPNFNFLKHIGINCSIDDRKLPSHNPDTMETNIPGVYMAGVVCGGMDTHTYFIENSREHAVKIVNNILEAER
ncbi:thioredoxin reductase (NADPH) [Arcticibacter tournemirensis]|uniref:YpdA family putative bacillithiol disulfide reductase n=1 Tax=Arcticibacter tournemirensis TaxID=699437 RepID=A0A5M9H4F0_9SPHI|nr:YpdA family putative bacillithiol disulfide reductase [Arcticibacter tournemirensis]KAA8481806.1 YpdA family putative bacillithiol disulfide reductase [Arcticibacter tournemirensis]TQM50158.1 thioredoxin reductase (NADPH) [Arcticibacter tournemirensis]